jgi:heptosyltransferase-3
MKKEIKEILVIKLRYLGDVVLTTPVFESLRQFYPQASITALVNKGTETMLVENPNVDRIFVLERDKNHIADLKKQLSLIAKLRKLRFDLALELTNNDRGAAYSFLSAAKRRLGYRPKRIKILDRHLLFTDLVAQRPGEHIVDRHLRMIEHLGYQPQSRPPRLFWEREEKRKVEDILTRFGLSKKHDFIVLHPILKAKYRAWRIEGYAKLCDFLKETFGLRTIMVCGKSQDEIDFTNAIADMTESRPLNLGGVLSLRELIVLISKATLFIGIDSGPMHMAAAVGTPLVAIFGPQNRLQWGPYGEDHSVIQKDWDCVPCVKRGCNDSGKSRCLDELSEEEVIEVVGKKLESILSHPK